MRPSASATGPATRALPIPCSPCLEKVVPMLLKLSAVSADDPPRRVVCQPRTVVTRVTLCRLARCLTSPVMLRAPLRSGVKALAAGADALRRAPRGLVVLIYHRVGARTAVEVDLPVELFENQIAWLAASVPAVTLDAGLEWLAAGEPAAGGLRVS